MDGHQWVGLMHVCISGQTRKGLAVAAARQRRLVLLLVTGQYVATCQAAPDLRLAQPWPGLCSNGFDLCITTFRVAAVVLDPSAALSVVAGPQVVDGVLRQSCFAVVAQLCHLVAKSDCEDCLELSTCVCLHGPLAICEACHQHPVASNTVSTHSMTHSLYTFPTHR